MTAGVAAADVALSGDAWMGLDYERGRTNEIQMMSRARVSFTLSGETDSGLAFGAGFRADNAGDAVGGTAGSVFISGEFGRLALGDVDSAVAATTFRTRHVGNLEAGGGSRTTAGLGAGTLPAALYTYSMEGFTVALGASQIASGGQQVSVGGSYSMGGFGVAVGYETIQGGANLTAVSGQASFDDVTVRAAFVRHSVLGDEISADVNASFDGIGVQLRVKQDYDSNNHIGAGVTYGLGGGATMGAGVNRVEGGDTTARVGLNFSF